jgi:hypothetical protein
MTDWHLTRKYGDVLISWTPSGKNEVNLRPGTDVAMARVVRQPEDGEDDMSSRRSRSGRPRVSSKEPEERAKDREAAASLMRDLAVPMPSRAFVELRASFHPATGQPRPFAKREDRQLTVGSEFVPVVLTVLHASRESAMHAAATSGCKRGQRLRYVVELTFRESALGVDATSLPGLDAQRVWAEDSRSLAYLSVLRQLGATAIWVRPRPGRANVVLFPSDCGGSLEVSHEELVEVVSAPPVGDDGLSAMSSSRNAPSLRNAPPPRNASSSRLLGRWTRPRKLGLAAWEMTVAVLSGIFAAPLLDALGASVEVPLIPVIGASLVIGLLLGVGLLQLHDRARDANERVRVLDAGSERIQPSDRLDDATGGQPTGREPPEQLPRMVATWRIQVPSRGMD